MNTKSALCILLIAVAYSSPVSGQQAQWESLSSIHVGISRDMIETPGGALLLSGPVSLNGCEGIGLLRLAAGAQALQDVSPSYTPVYALASPGDGNLLCASGDGIWLSLDDGLTWDRKETAMFGAFSAINKLPDGNCYAVSARGAVFISSNNGVEWDTVTTHIGPIATWHKPTDFIGMNREGWLVAGAHIGLSVISTDGGHTWVQNVVIEDSIHLSYHFGEHRHISAREFASISTDGASIGRQSADWNTYQQTYIMRAPRIAGNSIVESPSGTLFIGVGTEYYPLRPDDIKQDSGGVLISRDDGRSWSWLLREVDVQALILRGNGDLVASTLVDGFVRIDTSDGSHERLPIGFGNVSDILFSEGTLIAAMDSCRILGALRSTDHGSSWEWNDGRELMYSEGGSRLYAFEGRDILRSSVEGIHVSTDLGASWSDINLKRTLCISPIPDGNWISASYLSPEDTRPDCTLGFWDANWNLIKYQVATGMGMIFDLHFVSPDLLLAATSKGLFESTDQGLTWSNRFGNLFTIVSEQPNGTIYAAGDGEVYTSVDKGAQWSSIIFPGIPGNTPAMNDMIARGGDLIIATASQPFENNGKAAAGSGTGIHVSREFGPWTDAMDGMPTGEVTALAIDDAGYLYAGTRGCGMLRSSEPVLHVEHDHFPPLPSTLQVSVHPQPLQSAGWMTLDVSSDAEVTFVMRDLLGRSLRPLETRMLTRGTHHIPLDAAALPNGIYFLDVRNSEQAMQARFWIIR